METFEFWEGKFGNEYHERNIQLIENNKNLLYRVFELLFPMNGFFKTGQEVMNSIKSIIEFGSGIGQNTIALKKVFPTALIDAVEINKEVAQYLSGLNVCDQVYNNSILSFMANKKYDLVVTKGLLIHIEPDQIYNTYKKIYDSSREYILICEYYNPKLVEVEYRGHSGKLWKRDFAGEMLNMFDDLKLIDYGFVYHRDDYPQDDLNWFLMRKNNE